MKIVIDGRLYGLENAGLGRYLINLVSEISKIDSNDEFVLLLRKKYFDSLNLPSNWKKVVADFRHYSLTEQIKLPGLIKKEKPDLVHFPHFNVPSFYNRPYAVTIHDMLMHQFSGLSASTLPGPFYYLKTIAYKYVFQKAVTLSVKIIVPSNAVAGELVKYYKIPESKIKTIYEGSDEKIGTLSWGKMENPYFVYAGNAYPHKNLTRLVEAMVALNKQRLAKSEFGKESDKKVVLFIASARNVFVGRLEKIIEKLKASEFVKLSGFVPDEKLGSLFKNSLCFVFPSLSEGFGLPGLEAMNSGTILLASEIPVFREVYGKHAIYFNPLDFSSIEKAMKYVIEMDPKTRKERIEEAQEFSKRYSWTKMAKETFKIYEDSFGIRQSK